MSEQVTFQGSRNDVRRVARSLALMLLGRESDNEQVAQGFLLALGFGALSSIKQAFITKARGGTDEMGIHWPKLSKEYLAYGRRFGKGEQAALKKAAGLGKQHSLAPGQNKGLLTTDQLKSWRKIYAANLNRFLASMPEKLAKARAAQIAWTRLKEMGAKTKLEVFGNRQVEILRDTGILFNSLSPGILTGAGPSASYSKPTQPGGEDQIFDVAAGTIIVGTNHQFAAVHNFGSKKRGIPRRQFVPDDETQIPEAWWNRWLGIAMKSLEAGAAQLYRKGAA